MSFVTAIVAMRDTHWDLFKQNFQWVDPDDHSLGRVREDLTLEEAKNLKKVDPDFWTAYSDAGNLYKVLFINIPATTVGETTELVWLARLASVVPSFIVLGVWYKHDRRYSPPYGVTIHYPLLDENGDPTSEKPNGDASWIWNAKYEVWRKGTPIYPQHAQLINAMPPDRSFDNSVFPPIVTKTPTTELKQVLKISGHGDRMYL